MRKRINCGGAPAVTDIGPSNRSIVCAKNKQAKTMAITLRVTAPGSLVAAP